MAIKIAGATIVSDTKNLENIAGTDTLTKAAIEQAIVAGNNVLVIYDSTATAVRVLYGATQV